MTEFETFVDIVDRIKPILAGNDPGVQGAVLAELLSLWLAGHSPPEVREVLLKNHVDTVRELTGINAREREGANDARPLH